MIHFYTYKYKDDWIKNHEKTDIELHKIIDWKLNMLWNEKVFFVNETIKMKYFESLFYGWCDIGYFRNRPNDLNMKYLQNWPNPIKLTMEPFKNELIHYACVQNDNIKYTELTNDIINHYTNNLSIAPTEKYMEICFAGGFFILTASQSQKYADIYETKLEYYFKHNFMIKDDQTIIMDIITTNSSMFYIHKENETMFDNWFMFQRVLL